MAPGRPRKPKPYMDNLHFDVSWPDWQKRKCLRFTMEYPVRIKFQADRSATTEIETFSKNASIRGLLVRSPAAIPLNTPVTFVMTVKSDQSVRPIQLAGEAEIVRVEDDIPGATFLLALHCRKPLIQLEDYRSV
jgi:PilZ domain